MYARQSTLANTVGMRRLQPSCGVSGTRELQENVMLWTVTIVLVILWAVGFIGFHLVAWWIHLVLVLALVFLIFSLLGGRRV